MTELTTPLEYITAAAAADILGVTRPRVAQLAKEGSLPGYWFPESRYPTRRYYRQSEVIDLAEARVESRLAKRRALAESRRARKRSLDERRAAKEHQAAEDKFVATVIRILAESRVTEDEVIEELGDTWLTRYRIRGARNLDSLIAPERQEV